MKSIFLGLLFLCSSVSFASDYEVLDLKELPPRTIIEFTKNFIIPANTETTQFGNCTMIYAKATKHRQFTPNHSLSLVEVKTEKFYEKNECDEQDSDRSSCGNLYVTHYHLTFDVYKFASQQSLASVALDCSESIAHKDGMSINYFKTNMLPSDVGLYLNLNLPDF